MTSNTVDPSGTTVPASGRIFTTVPGCGRDRPPAVGDREADRGRALAATVDRMPNTLGTETPLALGVGVGVGVGDGEPVETTMLTADPLSTFWPAGGSC